MVEITRVLENSIVTIQRRKLVRFVLACTFMFGFGLSMALGVVYVILSERAMIQTLENRETLKLVEAQAFKLAQEASKCVTR